MIDVNDLGGLLELANDYVEDGLHFLTEPVSYGDLAILVERIIAAEKDAARWRFLAESPNSSITLRIHNSRCDQRDSVIDESMQCNK